MKMAIFVHRKTHRSNEGPGFPIPDLQFVGDGWANRWGPANQGYLRFGEIEAHTSATAEERSQMSGYTTTASYNLLSCS